MNGADLERAARVAARACDLARAEILPRFRSVDVEIKADGSPVTEADRAAERVIRQTLRDAYPDFGLVGEEYGEADVSERPHWLIDPIDGTIAYSRGIPLFSTLIALVEDGEPVMGVIDLPALNERFVGWRSGGCRRNGVPVQVSSQADLSRALVAHGDIICFEWAGQRAAFERMARQIPMLRGYTDAFGHALTIAGGVDAMVDLQMNPWDAGATRILVTEAGGACHLLPHPDDKLGMVFGSPALVEKLVELLED